MVRYAELVVMSLQRMLNESSDNQLEEGLKRTLMQRVREQSNNKTYLDMMIWFSLQQKDFRFALTQAKAVDARFPDLGGEQLYRVAQIAYSNGALHGTDNRNGTGQLCQAAI